MMPKQQWNGTSGSPIKLRTHAPATTDQSLVTDLVDDDSYYTTKAPTSSRRYYTTQGDRVIEQGNKRIIIHESAPKRRIHWMLILGVGMSIMIMLFILWTLLGNWWANHQLDATYGNPRTYQVDEVVGHADSTDHPTHFIFLNLSGHAIIVELPAGVIAHAKIYSGPQIFADNPSSVPVTGEFKDVNGDGRIDMIVHIGEQQIIYINDGTQFKPQQ